LLFVYVCVGVRRAVLLHKACTEVVQFRLSATPTNDNQHQHSHRSQRNPPLEEKTQEMQQPALFVVAMRKNMRNMGRKERKEGATQALEAFQTVSSLAGQNAHNLYWHNESFRSVLDSKTESLPTHTTPQTNKRHSRQMQLGCREPSRTPIHTYTSKTTSWS
jgi:hypothetical protein